VEPVCFKCELINWAAHRSVEVATGAGQRYRARLLAQQGVRAQLEGG
jgi:hypothetical protein